MSKDIGNLCVHCRAGAAGPGSSSSRLKLKLKQFRMVLRTILKDIS